MIRARTGFTLPELLVVLLLLSIVLGFAFVRLGAAADRAAVRAAVSDAGSVFVRARSAAIYRRAPVAVHIDTVAALLFTRSDSLLLQRRDLRALGVHISASRDSMAYDAHGLGVGAANLSLVVRRGRAADTLFLSRLGRVRW
ncbi:MAG TPA: prepilin-type N-terminal cleavage/methylation domain-containing protein [Gemmatimonadaceae bacterium]|nr:prepilin-type N-terminal cleavage/methylation domain-containing protein [Gemmatimonadaceae bacterium]